VKSFHGTNKKERLNNLEKIQRRWGVCLTTYGKLAVSFLFLFLVIAAVLQFKEFMMIRLKQEEQILL